MFIPQIQKVSSKVQNFDLFFVFVLFLFFCHQLILQRVDGVRTNVPVFLFTTNHLAPFKMADFKEKNYYM